MPSKERQPKQFVAERAEVGQEIPKHNPRTLRKFVQGLHSPNGARKPESSPSVELLLKALRITGSTQKLTEWMQTPVPALNGETPYALMQSEEGRKQVDAVLSRIEHGVY